MLEKDGIIGNHALYMSIKSIFFSHFQTLHLTDEFLIYFWERYIKSLQYDCGCIYFSCSYINFCITYFGAWLLGKYKFKYFPGELNPYFLYFEVVLFISRNAFDFQFGSVRSLSRVWLLWPHRLQHARPPCPSSTPGVYSNSCLLSWWCHPAIPSSIIPISSVLLLDIYELTLIQNYSMRAGVNTGDDLM